MYKEFVLSGRLRGKFTMPSSKSEQGQAILLIGLAFFLAGAFDPIMDLHKSIIGETGTANLKKVERFRSQGPQKLVGKYILSLPNVGEFEVRSRKIYESRADVPKSVKVAWELGEPHKAKVLGDYSNRTWPILLGILLGGFGVFTIRQSQKEKSKTDARV